MEFYFHSKAEEQVKARPVSVFSHLLHICFSISSEFPQTRRPFRPKGSARESPPPSLKTKISQFVQHIADKRCQNVSEMCHGWMCGGGRGGTHLPITCGWTYWYRFYWTGPSQSTSSLPDGQLRSPRFIDHKLHQRKKQGKKKKTSWPNICCSSTPFG